MMEEPSNDLQRSLYLNFFGTEYKYDKIEETYNYLTSLFVEMECTDAVENFYGFDSSKRFKIRREYSKGFESVYITSRQLYSYLMFGYFVIMSTYDDENEFRKLLYPIISQRIEAAKLSLEKMKLRDFESDKYKEMYEALQRVQITVAEKFEFFASSISAEERRDLLQKSVEIINNRIGEIEKIISGIDSEEEKLVKVQNAIGSIFEDEINPYFSLREMNSKLYFLGIIQDSLFLISAAQIYQRSSERKKIPLLFKSNSWFLYFYSFLMNEYEKRGENLLKVSKNIDILKYGATFSTIKNSFVQTDENNNTIYYDPGNKAVSKLFFILLGYGVYERAVYKFPEENDEAEANELKFELIDDSDKKTELKFSRLTFDFRINDFISLLFLNQNNALSLRLDKFLEMFNSFTSMGRKFDAPINECLKDVFSKVPPELYKTFIELKTEYESKTKDEQLEMMKEILNCIIDSSHLGKANKQRENMLKNITEQIKKLGKSKEIIFQYNEIVPLGKAVYISNNFFDEGRIKNENLYKKLLNEEKKIKSENSENEKKEEKGIEKSFFEKGEFCYKNFDISEKDFLKEKAETISEKISDFLLEKSKIMITVNSGINLEKNLNLKLSVYTKILFLIFTYGRLENDNEFIEIESSEKKNMFFSILVDTLHMIYLKDKKILRRNDSIREIDYLETLHNKTKDFFETVLNFSYEEIRANAENVNREHKEAQENLELFQEALLKGVEFYDISVNMFENPDEPDGNEGEGKKGFEERRYGEKYSDYSRRKNSSLPDDARRFMRGGPAAKAEPEEAVNMILKKYDWYDVFGD